MTTNTMKKDIAKLIEELDASPEGAKKVTLLIELLVEEGHERHEDIVFELGLTGDLKTDVGDVFEGLHLEFARVTAMEPV